MLAIPSLTLDAGASTPSGPPAGAEYAGTPEDAVSTARRFASLGFSRLHLTDDDSPRSAGAGREEARELLRHAPLLVQAEVRDRDRRAITDLLAVGAQWVVIEMGDLDDTSRLAETASSLPGRLILDIEPHPPVRWDARRSTRVFDLIAALEPFPFGGLLVAAPNAGTSPSLATLARIEELVVASPWPVQVRCAPDSLQQLRNLEDRGVSGALFAPTDGIDAIDPRLLAEEFAE